MSPRVPWKQVVEGTLKGPAKYKPGLSVEQLERKVWAEGTRVASGKPWKVMEFADEIGASAGKASRWVRVELAGDVIHGHPISFDEFVKLLTP